MLGLVLTAPAAAGAAEDTADRDYVHEILKETLETERTDTEVPWLNLATGSSGSIVIERTFYLDPDAPCRDYRRTLERPGQPPLVVRGTGCRVGPGRWKLDEAEPKEVDAGQPSRKVAAPADPSPAAEEVCPPTTAAPEAPEAPLVFVDYTMPTKAEL